MSLTPIKTNNNLVIFYLVNNKMRYCKLCNKPFFKANSNKKYCCKKCRISYFVSIRPKKYYYFTCKLCNKKYKKTIKGSKFCSSKCFHLFSGTSTERTCKICNKKFTVATSGLKYSAAKYCSKECQHKGRMTKLVKKCENCGAEFETIPSRIKDGKGKYCSKECADIYQTGKKSACWKGGTTSARVADEHKNKWKKIRKEIYKRDNYECQRCGKKMGKGKHPHAVHHIVSFSQDSMRYDPINLILLCERCHTGFVHSKKNKQKLYLASAINLKNEEN